MKTLKNKLKKGVLVGSIFLSSFTFNGCLPWVMYDIHNQTRLSEKAEDLENEIKNNTYIKLINLETEKEIKIPCYENCGQDVEDYLEIQNKIGNMSKEGYYWMKFQPYSKIKKGKVKYSKEKGLF
jgi:hypothetical protein